jgi:hypothetical protein
MWRNFTRCRVLALIASNQSYSSEEEAIDGIENDKWDFFVNRGGRVAKVVVAISRYGHKYLKTEADGEMPDNLLSLYECK